METFIRHLRLCCCSPTISQSTSTSRKIHDSSSSADRAMEQRKALTDVELITCQIIHLVNPWPSSLYLNFFLYHFKLHTSNAIFFIIWCSMLISLIVRAHNSICPCRCRMPTRLLFHLVFGDALILCFSEFFQSFIFEHFIILFFKKLLCLHY